MIEQARIEMEFIDDFMQTPLVIWVETLKKHDSQALHYSDLCDGVFLIDAMKQIDPRPAYDSVNRKVNDANIRIYNWEILMRNIRTYYLEVLQQLLVMKLPNIQCICHEPDKESSVIELRKVLLLVLGCAVQCERKGSFIDNIKQLHVEVQHAIVEYIKEVTDDCECVLAVKPPEQLEAYTEKMFNHLTRLIQERNDYAELVSDLVQDRDFYQAQAHGENAVPLSTTSPENHHMIVEPADNKVKVRRLVQELEEKREQIADIQEEFEDQKVVITKLKNENVDLIQDARAARTLRDEIDVLRETLVKSTAAEGEITKYKEKLNELEFYKARVEELREDNNILTETKSVLEEQLATSQKHVETVIDQENELVRYRQQIEEMSAEHDADHDRIWMLTEENARLQFEKTSMNDSTDLEQELESARLRGAEIGGTLSDQLTETTHSKLLHLELENQRLQQKLEKVKESSLMENTTLNLELEQENQRLLKKVEKFQSEIKEQHERSLDLEHRNDANIREKVQVQQAFETVKENAERQVKELEWENAHLSQIVETIQDRNEQTNDTRLKDLEKENKCIHQTISQKNQQLSKFEFENRQLQKSYNKFKQNSDRLSELENDCANLEKENNDLQKSKSSFKLKSEKLEDDYLELGIENQKLQQNVDSLKNSLNKKDQVKLEHSTLSDENQKLQHTLESLRNSSAKIVQLENEKDSMNSRIQQLQKSLEAQNTQRVKQEQTELDLLDLDNENQKLLKSLEIITKQVQQLEKDNSELEDENEKLQKVTQTLNISNIRFNKLQKENKDTNEELQKLKRAKFSIDREDKRNKQALLSKESALDELESRYTILEQDNRNMKKTINEQEEIVSKVHEIERENRELLQQVNFEKKRMSTLREDLVNEKIHSQQLSNELEKLHQELEKVGINKEKLVMVEQTQDDSRYRALESMMEGALKRSMEMKEEKIQALESRLEESKKRNIKLQEDLRKLKHEYESLKQCYEEETGSRDAGRQETILLQSCAPTFNQPNPAKQIFELKDYLVEVERKNATLIADNGNFKSQTNTLNEQLKRMENLNSKLQDHTASLQDQNTKLQSKNAKLQVDQSTLQSQCMSLVSKSSSLQHQLDNIEMEHERVMQSHVGLQNAHQHLAHDHESLQQSHEQLTSEYNALVSEQSSLKSLHESLKSENKELHNQMDASLEGKSDVNKFKAMLEKENEQMRMDLKALGNLQLDYDHLRDEHDHLLESHEQLGNEYRDIIGDHKRMKSEFNSILMKNGELRLECEEYKEQLHAMDLEITKLANRYEALYQVNQKMEDDNKNLLLQLHAILNNNQELLTQLLDGKDHFAVEEKSYLEKLSELKRQKERLEEKIMEHYKNKQDTQKKNKGLGAILVQKARILFRTPRSKSKLDLTNLDGSPENSSAVSGSFGELRDPDIPKQSDLNDEGGVGAVSPANKHLHHSSSGREMLTLEEFLSEANSVNKGSDFHSQDDTESKSSENSEISGKQKLARKHTAPSSHQNTMPIFSVPDVAAIPQVEMSRISSESSGSGHDVHLSTRPSECKPMISTHPGLKPSVHNFEDISQYSPFPKSQQQEKSIAYNPCRVSSPPPVTGSLQFGVQLQLSVSSEPPISTGTSPDQELSHAPVDNPIDSHRNDWNKDGLPPTERLDRLTMGGSPFSQADSSHHSDWSNTTSPIYPSNYSGGDQSAVSSQTCSDGDSNAHQNVKFQSAGAHDFHPQTSHVYCESPPHSNYSKIHQAPTSINPAIIPTNYSDASSNSNEVRQRNCPISAYDPAMFQKQDGNYNSDPNGLEKTKITSSRVHEEQPKSVPPNIFNAMLSQSDSHLDIHSNPVPQPQCSHDSRDSHIGGQTCLLREPNQFGNRPTQGQGTNTLSGIGINSGQQLPHGGSNKSQTLTARIQLQTKPAGKPANDGKNKDRKPNAIWYEYGCV